MTKPEYYDGVLNSLKQRQDHDSILASQIIESQQKRIGELERLLKKSLNTLSEFADITSESRAGWVMREIDTALKQSQRT